MSSSENNLNDLQRHSAIQDARISNLETKFEMFMQSIDRSLEEMRERDRIFATEMNDFKQEMRDRDNQRAKENAEIRNDIKEIYKTTDAKVSALSASIDSMGKHVRNISIAAFVGIGATVLTSVIGIAAMVLSAIHK